MSDHNAPDYQYIAADGPRQNMEPVRPMPNHLPAMEFTRRPDENNFQAARRLMDIWDGCSGRDDQ
jgi:hypothetical protein